jgi:hypothetical protein
MWWNESLPDGMEALAGWLAGKIFFSRFSWTKEGL